MQDVIALLPEHVANKIAAGEVVQRPSSVVKELLENAVDAGSTSIKLIIKDSGKTLIQVIDNGKGMSETDARLCFERHATSKIKSAEDLFSIFTKGFRGEALAAISAVAQVELKTKQADSPVGTSIEIEGNKVVKQEPASCATGASFSVKNLFFNIPARRNFLKEDATELRHIIDEFERVALPHPEISFSFFSNNNEIYHLPAGTLIQRITGLFGKNLKERLVSVDEDTPYLKIKGYVGKPETARKRRGEQYLFVNKRFVKNSYLHHAICKAYDQLILPEEHPQYFLFLDIDPKCFDINISPTKVDINFQDEKTVYAMVLTAVKRSLGKNNLAPSLDFDSTQTFDLDYSKKKDEIQLPEIKFNTGYNPFKSPSTGSTFANSLNKNNLKNWETMYEGFHKADDISQDDFPFERQAEQQEIFSEEPKHVFTLFQLNNRYILSESANGLLLIDQQRAHERVLFDHFKRMMESGSVSSQRELFPQTADLSPADFAIINQTKDDLHKLGLEIELLGRGSVVIHGIPSDLSGTNSLELLEGVLENFKLNNLDNQLDQRTNLCIAMARQASVKSGKSLNTEEMRMLVQALFETEEPSFTPSGKTIFAEIPHTDIDKLFKRK